MSIFEPFQIGWDVIYFVLTMALLIALYRIDPRRHNH
jgi:hypothetical protein